MSLIQLPNELWKKIFIMSDIKNRCKLRLVNRSFNLIYGLHYNFGDKILYNWQAMVLEKFIYCVKHNQKKFFFSRPSVGCVDTPKFHCGYLFMYTAMIASVAKQNVKILVFARLPIVQEKIMANLLQMKIVIDSVTILPYSWADMKYKRIKPINIKQYDYIFSPYERLSTSSNNERFWISGLGNGNKLRSMKGIHNKKTKTYENPDTITIIFGRPM
jgi:hypothetical protein